MKKRFKKLKSLAIGLAAVSTCAVLFTTYASAWNGNQDGTGIHADIANQSVQIVSNDMSAAAPQTVKSSLAIVSQYVNQLELGACFPDFDPNKYALYQDHFWDPDTGHNYTYSAFWYVGGKVDSTADTNVSKFTALAINDWKKGSYSTAVYELGEAMHFAGDLNCPYHAANITAVDSIGHVKYESFADTDGLKYLISTLNCKTTDATYASVITSDPLSTWITSTDTYFGKIAKDLYYSKSTMSNSNADWDYSVGIALPDAQKNCALLLYRFLNEVSGTIPACTTSFNNMQLVIKTADVTYAGTDDDIYFGLQTSSGQSYEFKLDNPGNDFERNQTDTYVLSVPATIDAKTVTKTWLRKSDALFGDDWMPNNIKVIVNGYVKQDVTIDQWMKGNTTYTVGTSMS